MTEPDAWEPNELERELLEAARTDRIPPELGLRMASALSITSGATAASPVAHSGLFFSKSGLWGVLTVALLAGAGALYTASSSPRLAAKPSTSPRTAAIQIEAPVPSPAPALAPLAPPTATAVRKTTAPVAAADADPSGALHAEISVLDRARQALEQAAPERAYRLLEQHRRRFARGTLIPEAEALRIEAVTRLGDYDRAQRMTQRFLSAYPAHPLAERVSARAATAAARVESSTSPSRATPAR